MDIMKIFLIFGIVLLLTGVQGEDELIPKVFQGVDFCKTEKMSFEGQRLFLDGGTGEKNEGKAIFPNLTEKQATTFMKYFEVPYLSEGTILSTEEFIGTIVLKKKEVNINTISLLKNPQNDDYIYIGFGQSEHLEIPYPSQPISFFYILGFEKSLIRPKRFTILDFTLHQKEGFCYFCSDFSLPPHKCEFSLLIKTWGGKNYIGADTLIKDEKNGEKKYIAGNALTGGLFIFESGWKLLTQFLIYLLPIFSFVISLVTMRFYKDIVEKPTVAVVGFEVTTAVVYVNVWFMTMMNLNDIPLMRTEEIGFTAILTVFFILISLFYVCGLTFIFFGTEISAYDNSETLNTSSVLYRLSFWVPCGFFLSLILYSYILNYIYLNPPIYSLLSKILLLNILTNAIGGKTICNHPLASVMISVYMGYLPFGYYSPKLWTEGYTNEWLVWYALGQAVLITTLTFQYYFGSRFFLPKSLRKTLYNTYQIPLSPSSKTSCQYCMNLLSEPELEYSDHNPGYQKFNEDIYYKTPCGHLFHPNCVISMATEGNCVVCREIIQEDRFID